jgi:hypothetical protein
MNDGSAMNDGVTAKTFPISRAACGLLFYLNSNPL